MIDYKIYTLHDPREPEHIRYVGFTTKDLNHRLASHIAARKFENTHKNNWIKSLIHVNIRPIISLYKIVSKETWIEEERNAIKYFRDLNHSLTNTSDGGDGFGLHTTDTKLRISNTLKEYARRPESRAKVSKDQLTVWENKRESIKLVLRELGFDPSIYKKCNRCNEVKLKSEFYKCNTVEGISNLCKECQKEIRMNKYYGR